MFSACLRGRDRAFWHRDSSNEIECMKTVAEQNLDRRHTILVVDDNRAYLTMLIESLTSSKPSCDTMEYVPATSVEEACLALNQRDFDLVVLDWHLDRKPASQVINLCRKLNPLIPIIVISGHKEVDVRTDAVLATADSFLEKPFSSTLLLSHIDWWLQRRAVPTIALPQSENDILPLEDLEGVYINHVVALLGNVQLAAKKLGIHRETLAKKLRNRPQ
jgi:DNA-binding NtrC family response regulator